MHDTADTRETHEYTNGVNNEFFSSDRLVCAVPNRSHIALKHDKRHRNSVFISINIKYSYTWKTKMTQTANSIGVGAFA